VRANSLAAATLCSVLLWASQSFAQEYGEISFPAEDAARLEALRNEAIRLEHGEGTARDPARAADLYCQAARSGDAASQFNLGWMYANGRGVERNDSWAAYFFEAAAGQGLAQADRMLAAVGGPTQSVPPCMQPPPSVAASEAANEASAPAVKLIDLKAPKLILDLVKSLAPQYQVEPQLALAIIKNESNFDALALSPKNAMGLMQLIPDTATRFDVRNPYDPKQNIRGGLAYLRWLLAYFEGDVKLVAAAYNAGEGTVERYRGVPPYVETRAYVKRIVAAVGDAARPFDASIARPSPQLRLIQESRQTK